MGYEMRPNVITTAVMSNDADGIAQSQAVGSATTMTLNGVLANAAGTIATLTNAQLVGITSGGNDTGITFTVVGLDANGISISDVITGVNGAVATGTLYFKTVTSITTSGAVATTALAGTLAADGLVTQAVPVNWRQSPFNMSLSGDLTAGTGGTFGMQYTVDNPEASYTDSFNTDANWRDVVGLDPDSISTDDDSNIAFPVRAVRGKFSTGSTDMVVKFTIIQGQNG